MSIFEGIEESQKDALFSCLQSVKKSYLKGEIIIDSGEKITSVGYVLDGNIQISKDDFSGNKVIIGRASKGETFAEAFVCAGIEKSKISIEALEDSQILFLDFKRILNVCSNSCPFHKKLIENIIKVIAQKNLFLQERIELLSKKTLRERIFYLLNKEKAKCGESIFEIPYSREQMAEFLGADRSALSRELSAMQKAGLIDFHKNSFKVYQD